MARKPPTPLHVVSRGPHGPPTPPQWKVDSPEITHLCEDIAIGMTIHQAAECVGLNPDQVRRRASMGAHGKGASNRALYEAISRARMVYREKVFGAVLACAAAGNPTALTLSVDRLDGQQAECEEVAVPPPEDGLEFLQWRLADVQRRLSTSTGIAYCKLLASEASLRAEVIAEERRRQEKAAADLGVEGRVAQFAEEWTRLPRRLRDRIREIVNGPDLRAVGDGA